MARRADRQAGRQASILPGIADDVLADFFDNASDAPRLDVGGWKPFEGANHRLGDDEAKTPVADKRKKGAATEQKKRNPKLPIKDDQGNSDKLVDMKEKLLSWMKKMLENPEADNPNKQDIRKKIATLDDDIDGAIDKINGSIESQPEVKEVRFHQMMCYLASRYDNIRLLIQPILKDADKRNGAYDSDSSTSTLPPPCEKLKKARTSEDLL